jgi:hypothetical protein
MMVLTKTKNTDNDNTLPTCVYLSIKVGNLDEVYPTGMRYNLEINISGP